MNPLLEGREQQLPYPSSCSLFPWITLALTVEGLEISVLSHLMHKHQLAQREQQENNPTCKHKPTHMRLPELLRAHSMHTISLAPCSQQQDHVTVAPPPAAP